MVFEWYPFALADNRFRIMPHIAQHPNYVRAYDVSCTGHREQIFVFTRQQLSAQSWAQASHPRIVRFLVKSSVVNHSHSASAHLLP